MEQQWGNQEATKIDLWRVSKWSSWQEMPMWALESFEHVSSVLDACWMYVQCMFVFRWMYVQCIYIYMFGLCWTYFRYVFVLCWIYVRYMFDLSLMYAQVYVWSVVDLCCVYVYLVLVWSMLDKCWCSVCLIYVWFLLIWNLFDLCLRYVRGRLDFVRRIFVLCLIYVGLASNIDWTYIEHKSNIDQTDTE